MIQARGTDSTQESRHQTLRVRVRVGDIEVCASGAPSDVRGVLDEFKGALHASGEQRVRSRQPTPDGPVETRERVPFAVFMKRDWPNQAARAAAIFTWVRRYEGKDRLKPGEMAAYWKRVDKRPGNPTMACQNAEKKGWLESVGGGYYAVVGHGEAMVDATPQPREGA